MIEDLKIKCESVDLVETGEFQESAPDDFDLESALKGAIVITKDGRKVTDIKIVDANAPFSADCVDEYSTEEYRQGVSAVIHNATGQHEYPFYHNGGAHIYGGDNPADLVIKAGG
tara:strand:+ start:62 stop:406 length:345 start_codon:yes stop_codon:yes gene_type:complete